MSLSRTKVIKMEFSLVLLLFVTSDNDLDYLQMRFWIGLWTGVILIIMTAFDLSALVRYITRFTEESFALLISLIFIKEAFAKLIKIKDKYPINFHPDVIPPTDCDCIPRNDSSTNFTINATIAWVNITKSKCIGAGGILIGDGCDYQKTYADVFFLSVILFVGTFTIAYALKAMKTASFFPTTARNIISDFAVLIAILSMVGLDALFGLGTPKLEVPQEFRPTSPNREWIVNPMGGKNPWWMAIAAVVPALLATILIFMDQQITAVIVNRKENKLLVSSASEKVNPFSLQTALVQSKTMNRRVHCSYLVLKGFIYVNLKTVSLSNSVCIHHRRPYQFVAYYTIY